MALAFLCLGISRIFKGTSGVESVKWNAISIGCAIYLFLYGLSFLYGPTGSA